MPQKTRRLYEQAQEEARKRVALARIAGSVALGGPLETALDTVARSVVEATEAVACSLQVPVGNPPALQLFGTYGLPEGYTAAYNGLLREGYSTFSSRGFFDPEPQWLPNARSYVLADPNLGAIHPYMSVAKWDTIVSIPSIYQERHVARLNFYYGRGREPGEAEMAFLAAIADHAAIAIENARLYAEVESRVALDERQRLGRELHDSVFQALYGIVLGAETARGYLDVDPERAKGPIEYVRSLADAGLAEMKALIFELRPESLEKEGLVAALSKHAAALRARHQLCVNTLFSDEPPLAIDAKEALYRIAEEALQNILKHAEAACVDLTLSCDEQCVVLTVRDDGSGFDPAREFPGHLGLKSMRNVYVMNKQIKIIF